MKVKYLSLLLCLLLIVIGFVGCDTLEDGPSEAIMPYGSDEYENGDWTVEELVEHFESLGFSDINTSVSETLYPEQAGIEEVKIEIYPSDFWFTEYRNITKGDTYETHREIYIKATSYVSTITINNDVEFADIVNENEENAYDSFQKYLSKHDGEYIEFDATVVKNWKPTSSSKGLYVHFAVEHGNVILYKNGISSSDLGLEGDETGYGVGAKVHILGVINDDDIKILLMTITDSKEIVDDTTVSESTQSTPSKENNKQSYILSVNTKKFHRASCRHVNKIKENNKEVYYGDRSELINDGYLPCGTCYP